MDTLRTTCVESLAAHIRAVAQSTGQAFIVALDGPSGAGKSTLAMALAMEINAACIDGYDFYAGGINLRVDSPAERANACIDWPRQRQVLQALRAGQPAEWRAFDWDNFDGRLVYPAAKLSPAKYTILEGVYAARPELADLLDMRVLVEVAPDIRKARLLAREGAIGPWEQQWHEAEEHYYRYVMTAERFELIYCESL
ncbi:MAG: uridine kinase family protein [Roseovarius sp.]